jgi:TPR repeat protein
MMKIPLIKPFISKVLLALIVVVNFSSLANDFQQADSYFENKQYELALNEYLSIADTKAPKVYYQLGVMHYKGLGTEADSFKALIWFSMAAEHNYDNSVEIVNNLIANVDPEEAPQINELIKTSQLLYSQEVIYRKYQPELNQDNLNVRIEFGEYKNISEVEIHSDDGLEDSLSMFMANQSGGSDTEGFEGFTSYDTFENEGDFSSAEPYFLIADYDIASDGSIRNISQVKTRGVVDSAEYDLSLNSLPKPSFKDENVHFINRSYLGIAKYNRFRMRREFYGFYKAIKSLVKRLSESELAKDQYNYGMALTHFPWLTQEDGDVDKLLKSAAETGYALAKYEYGLKLYREQKDVKQAVSWIFEAAKNDLSQAQYRTARILLDSPWVIKDEKKALFWLEQAANQGHITSKLISADVKLHAKDEALHDVKGAITYLSEIEELQDENPQFQYLQAMASAKKENRELNKAVKHIRLAIKLGDSLNWDVTPWQEQLKNWTSGGTVTIQD